MAQIQGGWPRVFDEAIVCLLHTCLIFSYSGTLEPEVADIKRRMKLVEGIPPSFSPTPMMAGPSENDAGSSASDRFSCSTYSAFSVDHILSSYEDDDDEEIPPVPPLPRIVVRRPTQNQHTSKSTPRPLPQPGALKSCIRKTTVNPLLAQSIQNRFTQLERGTQQLQRS
ncbi:hypothetical protein BJ165DRAFT_18854 [Panaeolus papilionaceus]|nr:hypothetical protein BJ165DRAFT_18854 [Panaeolus papilionaceus]